MRNPGIDIVKGLCIVLMVVGHSGCPEPLRDFIYMFHMPCFFILSGVLFKDKYLGDVKQFVKRRLHTIWRPFVVWTVIFVLLHNLFAYFHLYDSFYSIKEHAVFMLRAVFMRHSEQLLGGFWFLISLLVASLLSVAYYRIIGTSRAKLLVGIGLMLALSALFFRFDFSIGGYINGRNCLATAYFMGGTLLSRFGYAGIGSTAKVLLLFIALLVAGIVSVVSPREMLTLDHQSLVPYFVVSLGVSAAIIVFCTSVRTSPLANGLVYLGGRTMDILIYHFLCFKAVTLAIILGEAQNVSRIADFPTMCNINGGGTGYSIPSSGCRSVLWRPRR